MATEHEYRQMLERYRKAAQECRSRFDERIKTIAWDVERYVW